MRYDFFRQRSKFTAVFAILAGGFFISDFATRNMKREVSLLVKFRSRRDAGITDRTTYPEISPERRREPSSRTWNIASHGLLQEMSIKSAQKTFIRAITRRTVG